MKRWLTYGVLLAVLGLGCEGDYALYGGPGEVVYVEVPVEVEVPVKVPVEVLVEVPGEGGDVWIDSFEQPFTMDGIDIVWLIDKSGSMSQHSQAVVDGIEQMMLSLPPAGWRLGQEILFKMLGMLITTPGTLGSKQASTLSMLISLRIHITSHGCAQMQGCW